MQKKAKPPTSLLTSGKEGNVFMYQHGEDINDPANSKDSAAYDPQNPDYKPATKNAVDPLNYRIEENGKDKVYKPAKIINYCSSHNEFLFFVKLFKLYINHTTNT